jgi:hypothetical protein
MVNFEQYVSGQTRVVVVELLSFTIFVSGYLGSHKGSTVVENNLVKIFAIQLMTQPTSFYIKRA